MNKSDSKMSKLDRFLISEEAIDDNSDLKAMVLDRLWDEIKKAVWDCGSDKAPSPDGFSFQFLKRYWEIFMQDVELF
nr:RNA-directed DNA polymerase, eukaryota, reverse transcriptase zinc-binding domain protein [Tanacetum cinerariifolium]